ncbi:hypothetical protein OG792_11245 [Micromonospora sp. NBC_01699]|uniref:hypothetical protein n=1 Tax=Micromonospora sp. NBC_01699 TaxID=2975984 RepID=UPI002E353561|nr:hypothetical protein [Micromonospora sp. NBC_01699]
MLALLVALGSALVAWRAIDQANDARDIALAGRVPTEPVTGQPGPPPAPSVTNRGAPAPTVTAVESVRPTASGQAPKLDENTVYGVRYEHEELTLTAACDFSMYADLDLPQANVPQTGHDLRFTQRCGGDTSSFSLGDGVGGSASVLPGMTPQECNKKILSAPLGTATIPVRDGAIFCIRTSRQSALERGDDWRMVAVEVTGIAGNGAVTIALQAWNIPL